MQFCPECQNKLFPSEEDGTLWNKCRNCGYKAEYTQSLIEKKVYKSSALRSIEINKYMVYDPSLPRTIHNTCPNRECITHKKPELQEAVYIQDPNTIKLIYICTQCQTEWKYA
jgi:DNA-directed RNA polymerase subunit M/transcription elongation factor TFIIS